MDNEQVVSRMDGYLDTFVGTITDRLGKPSPKILIQSLMREQDFRI